MFCCMFDRPMSPRRHLTWRRATYDRFHRWLLNSSAAFIIWNRSVDTRVLLLFLVLLLIMTALWNRAGHYIFAMWFLLLSAFFSLPNLSRRRLDVCHTSTHGVALVQI